jgi:glycerol-3-phosphate dehydrogenase
MPICQQMVEVIYHGKAPLQALEELMVRELKPETVI